MVGEANNGVHLSQLLHMAADDISWDDSSDQFHHTIGNTTDTVDWDHGIGVVASHCQCGLGHRWKSCQNSLPVV